MCTTAHIDHLFLFDIAGDAELPLQAWRNRPCAHRKFKAPVVRGVSKQLRKKGNAAAAARGRYSNHDFLKSAPRCERLQSVRVAAEMSSRPLLLHSSKSNERGSGGRLGEEAK